MPNRIVYQELANVVQARQTCLTLDMVDMAARHKRYILAIMNQFAPSGSGIDTGTKIDLDASTDEELVFTCDFHHMDEHGGYDGWTSHIVRVKASLILGIDIRISGRDRNEIKEYLHDVFHTFLTHEFTQEQAEQMAKGD